MRTHEHSDENKYGLHPASSTSSSAESSNYMGIPPAYFPVRDPSSCDRQYASLLYRLHLPGTPFSGNPLLGGSEPKIGCQTEYGTFRFAHDTRILYLSLSVLQIYCRSYLCPTRGTTGGLFESKGRGAGTKARFSSRCSMSIGCQYVWSD